MGRTSTACSVSVSRAQFGKPGAALLSALGARAGVQAARLLSRQIARRLLVNLGRKTAAKTAARTTGIGGGAAAGAGAGAVLGPVGAAGGAVIGAVGSWLLFDFVVIELDELLNREAFEAELRLHIDAEKAALKAQILTQIAERRAELSLAGQTPEELLTPQPAQ